MHDTTFNQRRLQPPAGCVLLEILAMEGGNHE